MLTEATHVVVLAADLPFVTPDAIAQLVAAAGAGSAVAGSAMAVDDAGRDQPLLAAYSVGVLRAALPAEPAGASLRSVVARLAVNRVALVGTPPPWFDCDTPAQLAEAREWQPS